MDGEENTRSIRRAMAPRMAAQSESDSQLPESVDVPPPRGIEASQYLYLGGDFAVIEWS